MSAERDNISESTRELKRARAELARRPGDAMLMLEVSKRLNMLGYRHEVAENTGDALRTYDEALRLAQVVVTRIPDDVHAGVHLVECLRDLADGHIDEGDVNERADPSHVERAFELYRTSASRARELMTRHPGELGPAEQLSRTLRRHAVKLYLHDRHDELIETAWSCVDVAQLLIEREPLDAEYLGTAAKAFELIGDGQTSKGRSEEAFVAYDQALNVSRKIMALGECTQRARIQHHYHIHDMVPLIEQRGSHDLAAKVYNEDVETLHAIIERDPGSQSWHIALARTHRLVSMCHEELGAIPKARRSLDLAVKIVDTLIALDDRHFAAHRERGYALSNRGDLRREGDDEERAMHDLRESARSLRVAATEEEADPDLYRAASWSSYLLAKRLLDQGEDEQAMRTAQESFEQKRAYLMDAPSATDAYGFYLETEMMGDIHRKAGRQDDALGVYRRGLDIVRHVHRHNPEHLSSKDDECTFLGLIGDVYLEQDDSDRALSVFKERLDVARAYDSLAPDRKSAHWELRDAHKSLGEAYEHRDEHGQALCAHLEALAMSRTLAAAHEDDPEQRRELMIALTNVGDAHMSLDEVEPARAPYAEGLEIARELLAKSPDDPRALRDVTINLTRIANLHEFDLEPLASLGVIQEARVLRERVAHLDPENPDRHDDIAVTLHREAKLLQTLDQPNRAIAAMQLAVDALLIATQMDPGYQENLDNAVATLAELKNDPHSN